MHDVVAVLQADSRVRFGWRHDRGAEQMIREAIAFHIDFTEPGDVATPTSRNSADVGRFVGIANQSPSSWPHELAHELAAL